MAEKTVLVIGTLDTKGEELAHVRDRLAAAGVGTLLVDVGTLGAPGVAPDVAARRGWPPRPAPTG